MKKKVSVVIPTYNGEKYIEEQLMSIFHQTHKPDEIVISDDGSKDRTLAIVREKLKPIAEEYGIDMVILTDNPEHGWIRNYEWASVHATGDYIFNCDQDDIWEENKIEAVYKVFEEHPDALYVAHDISRINYEGEFIDGIGFFQRIGIGNIYEDNQVVQLEQNPYLQISVSKPFMNALATAVTQKLVRLAFPTPRYCYFDKWEAFCGICYGKAYFINARLARHRLHETNVTEKDPKLKQSQKFYRIRRNLKQASFNIDPYYDGEAMCEALKKCGLENTSAYQEALRVLELGKQKKKIAESGRILGVCKLLHLYRTSLRYRRSGPRALPYHIWAILHGRINK